MQRRKKKIHNPASASSFLLILRERFPCFWESECPSAVHLTAAVTPASSKTGLRSARRVSPTPVEIKRGTGGGEPVG